MQVTVYAGLSLDGFAARPDDGLDFLPAVPEDPVDGFSAFLRTVDAIVMGRRTFDVVTAFGPEGWPYGDTRLVVLSRTRGALPEGTRPTVSLAAGEPADVVARLAAEGVRHVYVDGPTVVQAFLAAGVVTDVVITWVPVLIGQGKPLFGALPKDVKLERVSAREVPGGLVTTRYRVAR